MSFYHEWGFKTNPFQQTPLQADETGERLLVGRTRELRTLQANIETAPRMPTIEGLNGVGKTSLVNVAAYKLFQKYWSGESDQLYIPCRSTFQLSVDTRTDVFIHEVYLAIAQTILSLRDHLISQKIQLDQFAKVDQWLNSPTGNSVQGGLSFAGFGVSGGTSSGGTNTGFEQSGLRKLIKDWLRIMYPAADDGGIVCIIDNLELLQVAESARRMLEQLRDELFSVSGVRCVLCGASGIIYGVASSPRLAGYLHSPIELGGVTEEAARDVLEARIAVFGKLGTTPRLPLTLDGFERLYTLLQSNLRSTLYIADEYCTWVSGKDFPHEDAAKNRMLDLYLDEEGGKIHQAVDKQVTPRAWKVFERAVEVGGAFSPGDFEVFGFNSIEAFRPSVKALEDVHLVTSVREENDKRRKSVIVLPKGYLVANYRAGRRK